MSSKALQDNDDFGLDIEPTRDASTTGPRQQSLGPLHDLLTRGLPDLVKENGILDTEALAHRMGISFQAVYKWYTRNQLPSKRLQRIIDISKSQTKKPKDFKVLKRDDFWEFIAR